jgi:transketolase
MDAVQTANSGHPGMPMGMADIAEVLWNDYLKHNPANPRWFDRDRFVLSNGHGSMLLYSLLHLTGYDLPMDEIRNFRQLGFRTAGHPEYDPDLAIETTTGPLGQGLSNAVGMAIAEKMLATTFNRPDCDIVNHRTYVFVGDGCLMEGISHEACSLAGTLGLGKLICFYDDNGISIDGDVDAWFTDDTVGRFEAYGWQVVPNVDGHDSEAISEALDQALADEERPSLICCKTVIGYGAPNKQGTAATHGAPLGTEEVEASRKELGWDYPPFEVPHRIRAGWDATDRGAHQEASWSNLFSAYGKAHPDLAGEYSRRMRGELPDDWSEITADAIREIDAAGSDMATRKASLVALNAFAPTLSEMAGGSADRTGSNLTKHASSVPISVFTHDSIGLGEDGPTHQPIEHVASLRVMPNMRVWRPCDSVETAVAWKNAIENSDGPTSLVLTRQGLPHQLRTAEQIGLIERGGYILKEPEGEAKIILIATGSEVALAMSVAEALAAEGIPARVVSMPCTDLFDAQPEEYRHKVLPSEITARVVVEAGVTDIWWRYAGERGQVVGIDRFGESAPAPELFEHFGFSTENVLRVARQVLAKN